MTVTMSSIHTVEMAGEGTRLAHVNASGDLVIYPSGLGQGMLLAMTPDDWARLQQEVRFAFMRAEKGEQK